jgi:pyruvate kinase
VSDVANAVMDGTDAVMLSAETAAGKYPVKAVAAMAEVIEGAETYHTSHHRPRERTKITFAHTDEAIAHSVMYAANHMHVRAIVALTESGSTTLWMSRLRSDIPIYAFTRHEATRRRVTLYRGVYPVMFEERVGETRSLFDVVFGMLLDLQLVDEGDYVILTKGERAGVQGGTNSMQILQVHR